MCVKLLFIVLDTARKLSKYGVLSGPYFPVLGLNTGKCGPEKTPYLDTFHAVGSFHSKSSSSVSSSKGFGYGVIHLVRTQNFPKN